MIKILKMYRKKSHVSAELFMFGEKNSLWRKKFALAKKIRFSQNRVQCVEKSLH